MPGASALMCYFHLHSRPALTALVQYVQIRNCVCLIVYIFVFVSTLLLDIPTRFYAFTSRFYLFLYVSYLCLEKPEILNLQVRLILFNDSKNERNSKSLKKRKQF